MLKNDLVLTVATVNGSGSQSANTILLKSLFRLGLPVTGKNLFPSNIAGLPTWFTIRAGEKKRMSRRHKAHIVVGMNAVTLLTDLHELMPGGLLIYNSDLKVQPEGVRADITCVGIPFRSLVEQVTESVKIKKLLTNMVYVGVVARLIGVDLEVVRGVVKDHFAHKADLLDVNVRAIESGWRYAEDSLGTHHGKLKIQPIPNGNAGHIMIDGNTAAALGLVYGGCSVMAWYPITPSSSLAEGFQKYAYELRRSPEGQAKVAVLQAEDELAALSMVLGAGWAGARAATATSGPGLSLMAEAAGLSYFAEIPAVIWDVQRVGPSTGLPTRTLQGDLLAAAHLSHGDTQHIVLLPGNPQECFEFGQTCFDLAERLQTLVIVLSDLDLGMNLWMTEDLKPLNRPYDRGKVLTTKELDQLTDFARYRDVDGDGIAARTLPGTPHPKAAYFTRGTGHDEKANYTENPAKFKALMDRLAKKHETAKKYVPGPVIQENGNELAFVGFGSSDSAIEEVRDLLQERGVKSSYLRLRALPLTQEVEEFLKKHPHLVVVDQNRDGQLFQVLSQSFPSMSGKWRSIRQYDGLPLSAEYVWEQLGYE